MYKELLPTLGQILALEELGQQQKPDLTALKHSRCGDDLQRTLQRSEADATQVEQSQEHRQANAEREWSSAIAALNTLLQQGVDHYPVAVSQHEAQPTKGVLIAGPAPVLESAELAASFSNWIFTPDALADLDYFPLHLLPCNPGDSTQSPSEAVMLPLLPNDPIAVERFCLILTTDFSLVLVFGHHPVEQFTFQFSFSPEIIQQVWRVLRSRLVLTSPQHLKSMDCLIEQFHPVAPDYQVVTQFSRLMLTHLSQSTSPSPIPSQTVVHGREQSRSIPSVETPPSVSEQAQAHPDGQSPSQSNSWSTQAKSQDAHSQPSGMTAVTPEFPHQPSPDTELLRAMAHEIRTPLTTIRTLTRSLLRRKELDPKVVQRLNAIDQECTRQIDRFNLIFRAVELETTDAKRSMGPLSTLSLDRIFQDSIPRWQQQARQRNINLEVLLPKALPSVVSDPTMLDQILTGLIERFTHSLPIGSDLQLSVMLAGHQLKLQFKANPHGQHPQPIPSEQVYTFTQGIAVNPQQAFRSVGQLLMVQPETGNLSLNLSATKNLFQALGGKLIVRHRPQQGEILTIFLPLEMQRSPISGKI